MSTGNTVSLFKNDKSETKDKKINVKAQPVPEKKEESVYSYYDETDQEASV